jgi:adenosylhomocysteine nucleosidase
MTDLDFDDPCLLFALGRESAAFRREFRPSQRFPGAPCWARFCGPAWLSVLVLETGVGAARTERALNWLLDAPRLGIVPYRPKLILSAGFAGALHEDYHVGDMILASEVVDADGRGWATTWPQRPLEGEWRPPLHRGRILSVARIIGSPDEKRALGEKHATIVVDMESATVARQCSERGVPFACVRAISDDCNTPLSPRLASLLREGRVDSLRLLGSLVLQPRMIGELWRLARQTTYAGDQLGKVLGELLTLTLPDNENF